MKISVFGCGYVGLTTAVGLAEMGNQVVGVDIDESKIQMLKAGVVPFYEPGLQEMLQRQITEKRLTFSTDAQLGIESSEIVFSAVGTPPLKDHYADLSAVLTVAKAFKKYARGHKIFVNKSTVPIGTSDEISKIIQHPGELKTKPHFHVVSNPEFLREGSAVQDFFSPDRIVVGLSRQDATSPEVQKIMNKLYRPMVERGVPLIFTDIRSSEVIKYASNAYLATRLSFINELANFCEKAGADIQSVRQGIGLDKRIGTHFFQPGIGFGGSCLPKDLNALIEIGKQCNFDFEVLNAVQNTNLQQPYRFLSALEQAFSNLKGKTLAVWGATFKPGTDDLRDAPSLIILNELIKKQAKIQVYDPVGNAKLQKIFGNKLTYAKDYYGATKHANAVLLLTEWEEFKNPDFGRLKSLMKNYYIFDGRNVFDPEELLRHGFHYYSIGRTLYGTSNLSAQRKLKSKRSRVKFLL